MASFDYQIIRRKGFSSSISIRVSTERGVIVRAPIWMPKVFIDGFVKEKASWIEKQLNNQNRNKVTKKYEHGEKHLFFGKEYPLSLIPTNTPSRCRVELKEEELKIEIYSGITKEKQPDFVKEALLYWYLEMGIEAITEKVNFFSKEIGVNYQKINLKKVSSIWGSCSSTNCLSFNRKLVMAPHEVVDYVVIHEVSHMVHRNHGKNFWNLVARFDPQYKNHRKWLKLNHHLLAI